MILTKTKMLDFDQKQHSLRIKPIIDVKTGIIFKTGNVFEAEKSELKDLQKFSDLIHQSPMTLPMDIQQPEVEDILSGIFGPVKIFQGEGNNVTSEIINSLKENMNSGIEKGMGIAENIQNKGGEILSDAKDFVEEKWTMMERLYWMLIILQY